MTAKLLEGTTLAGQIRGEIARDAKLLKDQGRKVCLTAVQVGEQAESVLYVKNQERVCAEVGITFRLSQLPTSISQAGLLHAIEELNNDPTVHGIILQLPLPARLDARLAQRAIDPRKDAEGVHPVNLGLIVYGVTQRAPCTAIAAYSLIKSLHQDLYGKEAVVVGHSQIVGKPIGLLLLHDYCTVCTCHIATRDLGDHTRRADLLVVAAGKPNLIKKDMVKPGAIVVDIGVNRVPVVDEAGRPVLNEKGKPKHKVVGDVDFEGVKDVAEWITPVPGGVGPLTVTMLLRNVIEQGKAAAK
ncbi:MAG: bifunctional 5,10-methylenetetrahydrofolate dehydrogenase/5,10-methenyltetrahydrofolate cyclohydrolase [Planctomycetota bacterium]|nr:bifunctional 5,10-methylenetetrahydrofolate dehydrogenase/5,10-methenyltetrahydrofolate cyclohydrolase [Planctomycetota bacterium]